MGDLMETVGCWVANENAVISPPWSIHLCGCNGKLWLFIWGMAVKNLDV